MKKNNCGFKARSGKRKQMQKVSLKLTLTNGKRCGFEAIDGQI